MDAKADEAGVADTAGSPGQELPVLHVFSVREITANDGYHTRFEVKGGEGCRIGQEDRGSSSEE